MFYGRHTLRGGLERRPNISERRLRNSKNAIAVYRVSHYRLEADKER